ncbi:glycosyl hydrolase family 5 protein/cellulase [Calycina marina]|uniref:Glycosyl hydrolase family 5 protein/cellulase n=1 Tax=Calycina marina TaxID=1763456 RepID=A0A9P7ZBC8_9HELO|nr:glycosyl hydrolase family 5 protein/cellulase [Calycina marina]
MPCETRQPRVDLRRARFLYHEVHLSFLLFLFRFSILLSIFSCQLLHTSGRWILNLNNQRIKLRCVKSAGHNEVSIPEVDAITAWVAKTVFVFKCARLTYFIDMALNPNQKVSDSFTVAASLIEAGSPLTALYTTAVTKNSWLSTANTCNTYDQMITSLGNHGIMVFLDNHNSHAGCCCHADLMDSTTDGKWLVAFRVWAQCCKSEYFNRANWLAGIGAMATFGKSYSNVIGPSLRNELRAVDMQDVNSHADWYSFIGQGTQAIHTTNPNSLIILGGVNYATDLSLLHSNPLDRSSLGNKVMWEFHSYTWSNSIAMNCPLYTTLMGNTAGYLVTQNQAYTGRSRLSEFGWAQTNLTAAENQNIVYLSTYMVDNDAERAYWDMQGSYYYRGDVVNYDESFSSNTARMGSDHDL